jgi:hypothetical protein
MTEQSATLSVHEGGKRGIYDHPWSPLAFDLLTGALFVPFGGVHRLRTRVAILDWAVPANRGVLSHAWRWFLMNLEPASVQDCLERGYKAELDEHGLQTVAKYSLAGGTVQLILGRRCD